MRAKAFKIVAWTLGTGASVYLITDGKRMSQDPVEHAVIGAGIGLPGFGSVSV
jgi:hypothetical protein